MLRTVVRMSASGKFVQSNAERKDIGMNRQIASAASLLRRHVALRSGCKSRQSDVGTIQMASETDINEDVSTVAGCNNVRRFDVAVDDSTSPKRLDCLSHVSAN